MTTTPTMPGTKAAVVAVPKNMEARILPLVSGVPGQQTAVVTAGEQHAGQQAAGHVVLAEDLHADGHQGEDTHKGVQAAEAEDNGDQHEHIGGQQFPGEAAAPVHDDPGQGPGDGTGGAGLHQDLAEQVGGQEFQQEHGHGGLDAAEQQRGLRRGTDAGAQDGGGHVHPGDQGHQNGGQDHAEGGGSGPYRPQK